MEDPLPVPEKPEPTPQPEPPPSPKEEPLPPKSENPKPDEPPAPKQETPKPPDPLQPIRTALSSRDSTEKLKALESLRQMGAAARPAADLVCELMVEDPTTPVGQAAQTTLEVIHPQMHRAIETLNKDPDAGKNIEAARTLAEMGDAARGTVPLFLEHIRSARKRFAARPDDIPAVLAEDAFALGRIGRDLTVQTTLLDLTRTVIAHPRVASRELGRPVREAAFQGLVELLQRHPEEASKVVPELISAIQAMTDTQIREQSLTLLGTLAEKQPELRSAIASGYSTLIRAGDTALVPELVRCGRDALPILERLKLHPNATVRKAASDALTRVEVALAAANAPKKEVPDPTKVVFNPPKKEEPRSRPEATVPEGLLELVGRLREGTAEDRAAAAAELASLGERAAPAASALCRAATDRSETVSRAALRALEKVRPDLHRSVFVLLIDDQASNHTQALVQLGAMGNRAKPAVSVVQHQIQKCLTQLQTQQGRWTASTFAAVIIDNMDALVRVAPEDPEVVKTICNLSRARTPQVVVNRQRPGFQVQATETPFRQEGVYLLGELAATQPAHREQILPVLSDLLKEATQKTAGADPFVVLDAMTEVDRIGTALWRCGAEGKKTLKSETLPKLDDLQFHKSEKVRQAATALRQKIENAP